jgi:hypothetical protein
VKVTQAASPTYIHFLSALLEKPIKAGSLPEKEKNTENKVFVIEIATPRQSKFQGTKSDC